MRLLLEAGAEIDTPSKTPLHAAVESGHLEAVRFLVQNGAQKDVLDDFGCTPLGLAVQNEHLDLVRFLVEEGANKDELFNKRHGTTALHFVAEDGNLAMVRFLVEIGCDRDATDDPRGTFGGTPLHRAAEADRLDIVRFLWSPVPVVTQPTKMHLTTAMPKWLAFCLSSRQNPSRKVPRSAVTVRHSPTSWR
jgi:ankyrin repeat protein